MIFITWDMILSSHLSHFKCANLPTTEQWRLGTSIKLSLRVAAVSISTTLEWRFNMLFCY